jgi:two-component system, sensor histidine kinase and response regulator
MADELDGARILLVEDNEVNQMIGRDLLLLRGAEVIIADNGLAAVDIVKDDSNLDAVLMDIELPKMDGYTATRLIRERYSINDLPVIAMTAYNGDEDKQKCREAGMNDFVIKPFMANLLYSTLTKWLILSSEKNAQQEEECEPCGCFILNSEKGASRMGGNRELYGKVLDKYKSTYRDSFLKVNEDLNNGSYEEVKMFLHTLKGSTGTIGGESLYDSLIELEQKTRNHSLEIPKTDLLKIEKELECLLNSIEKELDRLSNRLKG